MRDVSWLTAGTVLPISCTDADDIYTHRMQVAWIEKPLCIATSPGLTVGTRSASCPPLSTDLSYQLTYRLYLYLPPYRRRDKT